MYYCEYEIYRPERCHESGFVDSSMDLMMGLTAVARLGNVVDAAVDNSQSCCVAYYNAVLVADC